jgi:hypothetical protein
VLDLGHQSPRASARDRCRPAAASVHTATPKRGQMMLSDRRLNEILRRVVGNLENFIEQKIGMQFARACVSAWRSVSTDGASEEL